MQETTLIKKENQPRGRGRPVLEAGLRKDCSVRFRVSTSDMELLELTSRLCSFESRGEWAVSRLLLLARAVVQRAGISPSDPLAVRKALEQIEKVS